MYNIKKSEKKEKCNRVLNLYSSSINYHKKALDDEQLTFEDFKYDVLGLLESLKRYVKSNSKMMNASLVKKLCALKLNECKDKRRAILELDSLNDLLNSN